MVTSIVGTGFKPRSKHPDKDTRNLLHTLWNDFNATAGINDETFDSLCSLLVRQMIESGEGFAQIVDDESKKIPLSIVQIDPAQVQKDFAWNAPPGNLIRESLEFSPVGRVIAYHAMPFNPNDPFYPLSPNYTPLRIPAEDMLHLFKPLVANQIRGLSWLAPVLTRVAELDGYQDAALARAKTAALFAGYVKDLNDDAGDLARGLTPDEHNAVNIQLEPGTISSLPASADIIFTNPPEDPNYVAFTRSHLEAIASGLGTTYPAISGDYSQANFSSMRSALVEHRRLIDQLQYQLICPRVNKKVWDRVIKASALAGLIPNDFFQNPEPYLAVDWLPARFDWVDPLKDASAEIEMINAGLKSRSQSIAELGYDVEEVDAQIKADHDREMLLGLSFTVPSKLDKKQVAETNDPTIPPGAVAFPGAGQ